MIMKKELTSYTTEIKSLQSEIHSLKSKNSEYQEKVKNDPLKQKAMILHERINEAKTKKKRTWPRGLGQ